jgi:transcriptional regulator with XRE-family HTH domain
MTVDAKDETLADRAARFSEFLASAKQHGMSQTKVAARLDVPRQYVTNVKNGDRVFTESFARRVAEEFDVDHLWLLNGTGSMQRPSLFTQPKVPAGADSTVLPLLTELVSGEPRRSSAWDGAVVSINGPAVYLVGDAVHSYVYRVSDDDSSGRLKRGDLVLICQGEPQDSPSTLALLAVGERPTLAWSTDDGRWKSTRTGRVVSAESEAIGYCLGIVWARF